MWPAAHLVEIGPYGLLALVLVISVFIFGVTIYNKIKSKKAEKGWSQVLKESRATRADDNK